MAINHDAPKDLGWAEESILDIDTRLKAIEKAAVQSPAKPDDSGKGAQGQK